jgi:hypothetical protein
MCNGSRHSKSSNCVSARQSAIENQRHEYVMTTPMDDTLTAIGRQLSVAHLPTVLEPLPRELNDLVAHASVAPTRPMDCRFLLRGPMAVGHDAPSTCWREAPALGHTGSTRIVITPYGIMADVVAYDRLYRRDCRHARGYPQVRPCQVLRRPDTYP